MAKTAKKVTRRRAKTSSGFEGYTSSIVEVAETFGVHRDTAKGWRAKAGCPGRSEKGYSFVEFGRWLKEGKMGPWAITVPQYYPGNDDPDAPALTAKQRKEVAEATIKEVEAELKKKSAIPIELAVRKQMMVIDAVVAMCNRAGAELAGLLAGESPVEMKRTCKKYFDERRNEIADLLESKDDGEEDAKS